MQLFKELCSAKDKTLNGACVLWKLHLEDWDCESQQMHQYGSVSYKFLYICEICGRGRWVTTRYEQFTGMKISISSFGRTDYGRNKENSPAHRRPARAHVERDWTCSDHFSLANFALYSANSGLRANRMCIILFISYMLFSCFLINTGVFKICFLAAFLTRAPRSHLSHPAWPSDAIDFTDVATTS